MGQSAAVPANILPERVLIATFGPKPPLGEGLAAAFNKLGTHTQVFHTWPCNTLFDQWIIHPLNRFAHNLRLVPKSVSLFEGHPKSHKEWRSAQLLRAYRQFQPDLVIMTGVQRLKKEVLQEMRDTGIVFFWFSESEKRFREVEWELPYYHHLYFMSSLALRQANELGFTRASLLQHAVDTSQFYPLDLPKKYDWCFVGQWNPRRQQYAEGLAEVSKNFVIYGPRWRKHTYRQPALWWRIAGQEIWGEPLTRLYNQTRVVINVSVWGDERQGATGVNQRLLEVPACRVCLLSDYARDALLLLTPEKDFVSAVDLPDMQRKLADLLADEHKRQQIADRGYKKATSIRTYDHLAAQLCADWAEVVNKRR